MTEQQKITALYEKLPPDKKLEVTLMMRTLSAMMATLVTINTEQTAERRNPHDRKASWENQVR